jgi:uncharacterized protein (TIGR00251 family)
MSYYTIKDDGLLLRVFLQPNAKADEVVGIHGGHLKIKVKAPAREGKANEALVRFLAKWFGVPRKEVFLEKGNQSRYKQVRIHHVQRLPTW